MAYKTKRSKVVKCDLTISDLVGMADGIFEGNHDPARHGWVTMAANLKGRACVNALFPKAHIAWRDPGEGLPIDWLGFDINVPDVIAATATKLPLNKARLDERIRPIVGVVESGLFISRADPVFVADAAGVHRRYSARAHRGSPQLVDDFLPKPRVLHPWPNVRFAVKHPKVGAECPNWARSDLCRGHSVMSVPTAISKRSVR